MEKNIFVYSLEKKRHRTRLGQIYTATGLLATFFICASSKHKAQIRWRAHRFKPWLMPSLAEKWTRRPYNSGQHGWLHLPGKVQCDSTLRRLISHSDSILAKPSMKFPMLTAWHCSIRSIYPNVGSCTFATWAELPWKYHFNTILLILIMIMIIITMLSRAVSLTHYLDWIISL